ncbi:MAG: isoamylase early set domain-containing protein [Bacteroidales bacterium]
MIEKRQFLKTKPVCKVTFKFKAEAENLTLVGDFNGWDETANPMKKAKDGTFSVSVEMESGIEQQFRYLADGKIWLNDEAADKYTISSLGSENSVVIL